MDDPRRYAECPQHKDCGNLTRFSLGLTPVYVSLVSDFLSCVASVAMVLIYLAWKDIRKKGAQSIVTFIAIADFFTASAYFAGSVIIIVNREHIYNEVESHRCKVFNILCLIESCVVTWATMSSYLWTVILAFYFYLAIVRNRARLAMKMIPLYHVIAWGTPIPIVLPLLKTIKLKYAPFVSTVWCYLDYHSHTSTESDLPVVFAVVLPEVLGYVVIFALYVATLRYVFRFRTATPRCDQALAVGRVEKILFFIPVLFIILRVWGTVQYLYVFFVRKHASPDGECVPESQKMAYVALGVMQAVGSGGQGWANAILYIFLSPSIRNRLFHLPCRKPTAQTHTPSSTFYSPPISNYRTLSTDSIRNLM